eukprot:Gregarina_sp_Poly_1__7773@NODE_43_length_18077_cov_117_559078_g37_i0_p8_GENE_NODE_43_length_18077_cov_117_559078_g37_i0NODE_43_length_18077_cov_117_559078_g37_i0_p8_ORF_typecomplete_len344_score21_72CC/PF04942_14/8_5e02CC/PF04942_14/17CC/PF04942_14/48CC/PF04942_14/4_5e02CC/PF04942_14/1_6e03CC/PF04942_14/7_7e02_NODE_43_length_18077_cov_117_559078_g37_i067297760
MRQSIFGIFWYSVVWAEVRLITTELERGLRVLEQFGGTTTCPEEFVYKNGVCQQLLRQAPFHSCPPGHQLIEGECIGAYIPELSCPSNYLLMASNFCERTTSLPCEIGCPEGSIRNEEGLCVREVEAPYDLACIEGTLDAETAQCINRIHSKPIITCTVDKAKFDDGMCISIEESTDCDPNDLINKIERSSERVCIRLRSSAPKLTCSPGSWLDRTKKLCIRSEYTAPKSVCHKTVVGDRCVENVFVHPTQSCIKPFAKRSIFGLCTCQLVEREMPIQSCVGGAELDKDLGRCIKRSMVKFQCPPSFQLHGTLCERLIETEALRTFNMTVACVLRKGELECEM